MQLSIEDVHLFYKLNPALLFYVNKKLNVLADNFQNPEELRRSGMEKVGKVRDKLLENIRLIDDFVKENPFEFSHEELDIISSWKHHTKGRFFILKYLKNYAVFLDTKEPAKAYGVKALVDSFEDIMEEDSLPAMVDAVLLPFKQGIIYDGFLACNNNIYFGAGIRSDLNEEFKIAKVRFGIIESLPYDGNRAKTEDNAEKLKRYLKTETSRQYFSKEIYDLTGKNRELEIIYHQEMGKIYSRSYKKDLRGVGIGSGWFGILQGVLIAGNNTKEGLDDVIEKIVPPNKQNLVFRFQLKNKN